MPTIWYEQGFRFWFYASDGNEPPHVHVEKGRGGGGAGKWWIESGREAWSRGFNARDRAAVGRIVRARRGEFLERWRAFFGDPA